MKITEDQRADRDWLVQTLQRAVAGEPADQTIAWNDLREAGWSDVFDRISGTWRQFNEAGKPIDRMSYRKSAALLQTCGVFRSTQVLAALDVWMASPQGGQCPTPADLYGLIAGRTSDPVQNAKPRPRPESRPEVLSLVADLIGRDAESECACHPRPTGVNFVMDERSVIYCPLCAGIEQGQAYEAELHDHPFDEDREETVSAVVLLQRARAARWKEAA